MMKRQSLETSKSTHLGVLTEFRVYSVKEVATVYYPSSPPEVASRSFRKLLRSDKLLYDGLCNLGFKPHARTLSPAQLRFIAVHLGTPGEFYDIMS